MKTIDRTIGEVERLYETITGEPVPDVGAKPFAAIPPEVKPEEFIDEQLTRLTDLLASPATPSQPRAAWAPLVSVWESREAFVVEVDLPGVEKDSVNVAVEGRTLRVSAQREAPQGYSPRWVEHVSGKLERVLTLPNNTADPVHATLRDGVLEIRIPRGAGKATTQAISID